MLRAETLMGDEQRPLGDADELAVALTVALVIRILDLDVLDTQMRHQMSESVCVSVRLPAGVPLHLTCCIRSRCWSPLLVSAPTPVLQPPSDSACLCSPFAEVQQRRSQQRCLVCRRRSLAQMPLLSLPSAALPAYRSMAERVSCVYECGGEVACASD